MDQKPREHFLKIGKSVDGFGQPLIKPRRKSKRLGAGPRTKQWARIRSKLKVAFWDVGITRCEQCGADNYLGFAHRMKRRYCDERELHVCALLCQKDHDACEAWSHTEMYLFIDKIIKRRTRQPLVEQ